MVKPDDSDMVRDPDPFAAIEESTALVVTEAQGITITDQDSYAYAGAFVTKSLKPALREIEARFRPMQRAADASKKEILDQRRALEDPLKEAERITKQRMGVWLTEQRRITAEAEAERLRVAREEAETATLAEAARLEEAGHTKAAEEMITAPVVPVVSAPPPEEPKAAGVSARFVTKYRIIDARKITAAFMMPDEKKIGQIVRSMGADAAELVGGIEIYEEPVIAASAR